MGRFVVERSRWRDTGFGLTREPGWDTVAIFDDFEQAEEHAQSLEWQARHREQPFCVGPSTFYSSSLSTERLHDWMLDLGLEAPPASWISADWSSWWADARPGMTARQLALAWEALDRVRYFRARPAAPTIDAQVMAHSVFARDPARERDVLGSQCFVGCSPYMLSFDDNTANSICQDLYLMQVSRTGSWSTRAELPADWSRPSEALPGSRWVGSPVDEVHRVACPFVGPAPRPGQDVYIVLRHSWIICQASQWWRWARANRDPCGKPVAAFANLDAADAHAADLERDARQHLPSPFYFGPALEWSTLHATSIWGALSDMAPIVFSNLWSDYQATDRLWIEWWDSTCPHLTAEQLELTWALFDRLRFYEVVAVEYRP